MTPTVTIHYLGNFGPPHSTENHIALSLESLGHTVHRIQEGETPALDVFYRVADNRGNGQNVFLWTQTYGLAVTGGSLDDRWKMILTLSSFLPTVAFHLDRWWGLAREHQVSEEPFFQCNYVFTADGGHQEEFSSVGVNHFWLPPAVYHGDCYDGTPRREFKADVAFVGSWKSYGHEEWWPRRKEMLDALRQHYGPRFKCFPRNRAIRDKDLNDLYASVKVVVGDSCLAPAKNGQAIKRYWSDRIPETTGRGGFLVHPHVEGLDEVHRGVSGWPLGDTNAMISILEYWLDPNLGGPHRVGTQQRISQRTREENTYRDRMQVLLDTVLT